MYSDILDIHCLCDNLLSQNFFLAELVTSVEDTSSMVYVLVNATLLLIMKEQDQV